MASTILKNPVSSVKLSSVVPGEVTGNDKDHELTNMDLALKLHYVRGVYFFNSEAVQGLTVNDLKKPMFPWLTLYHTTSGRIRRSETGRPFVKCNDGGVRIVEAYCEKTIEEWLDMNDHHSLDDCLVYDGVLGPDLAFSPSVYIQFTWFKCGGMSLGLSWAHVLGDPFSASTFINMWGQIMQGHVPPKSLNAPNPGKPGSPLSTSRKPFSVKQVDPVGDHWLSTHNCKMETYSFHFTAKHIDNMLSDIGGQIQVANVSKFEVISALLWKSLSKIRKDSEPRIVTICTSNYLDSKNDLLSNKMVFSTVRADFSVAKSDINELAVLIAEKKEEENNLIEEMMDSHNGLLDCVAYGTNLTFINLEDANIYGLELKGRKPFLARYNIKGVGAEGAVLVLPGPDTDNEKQGAGRIVAVILPENQLIELKNELKTDWGLL